DLDLLTARADRRRVEAALARAGFVRRAGPAGLWKRVYVGAARGEGGALEFGVIDLHEALVQDGIIYADAAGVLARTDAEGTPAPEDLAVLLVFHKLLAGKPLEGARLAR